MNAFSEGVLHITDIGGYDHMLFLLAMSAPFTVKDWKSLILLATAFTLGHSVTLALAGFQLVKFNSDLIELLIPITIALTSLYCFFYGENKVSFTSYAMVATFGLIHGLGFSSYFRMMFDEGTDAMKNLFLFNLGVEFGQVVVLVVILALFLAIDQIIRKLELRKRIVAGSCLLVAGYLVFNLVQ